MKDKKNSIKKSVLRIIKIVISKINLVRKCLNTFSQDLSLYRKLTSWKAKGSLALVVLFWSGAIGYAVLLSYRLTIQLFFSLIFLAVVVSVHPHWVLGILAEPVRTFDNFFFRGTNDHLLHLSLFYFCHTFFLILPLYCFIGPLERYSIFFIMILEASLFLFLGNIRLKKLRSNRLLIIWKRQQLRKKKT